MTREKQLNNAAFDYVNQRGTTAEWCDGWEDFSDAEYVEKAFKEGAEWEHKRLVEKACDWLYDNFYEHPHEKNFICSENFATIEDMIAWFQIIMEE